MAAPPESLNTALPGKPVTWRNLWQMPTIIISIALIVIGLRSAIKPPAPDDFPGALDQVEQFIAQGKIDPAFQLLREVIEPSIGKASVAEQARFHALCGDLTAAAQDASDLCSNENNQHIIEQYAKAQELGLALSPVRLERWAQALLNLDDFAGARTKLAELRAMAAGAPEPKAQGLQDDSTPGHAPASDDAPAPSHLGAGETEHVAQAEPPETRDSGVTELETQASAAQAAAARLFRHIIERELASPRLEPEQLMEMLAEHRMTQRLTPGEEAWVAARLAELRLETGKPALAVDGLLVEMRRIEGDAAGHAGDPANFGELYVLLGHGYLEMGRSDMARQHLNRALTMLGPSEPARGDALALVGQIDLAHGEHDAAFDRFNTVVDEFVGTRACLPAMLGRAEVHSILGDHAAAQNDFREVASLLQRSPPRRDVTADVVARRLCDRHDAALALGRFEQALEYASIAEMLFEGDDVPQHVLLRVASTNRQIAENLLASLGRQGDVPVDPSQLDPAVRYEAHRRFDEAGRDYLRHVAARGDTPLSDEDWGSSLWAAADCFDRAGEQGRAIAEFERYLGSRAPDDSRRAEAMFRIALAYHAQMKYEKAIEWYQQVLADRTRSSFAARCHVPLARCQAATGRTAEARQTLQQVLAGERLLDPTARDYRDALIELGRLHHDQNEFTHAIERLAEARQRYPDDPRRPEIDFLLADSYRGSALEIDQRLADEAGVSPVEAGRLRSMRAEYLQNALQLFGEIVDRYAPSAGRSAPPGMHDMLRRAHLYRADCAFALGQYEHSVELYEMASRQFADGASSMYALVQIVNCYSAVGDDERAAAAHQRALLRLRQLPESAFAAGDALMDRGAWERWLSSNPAGRQITASAHTDAGG
jgi:tetratricopeptide (TPR) repeat protein